MDCHIHTPASLDFQQPEATNLDILQKAEARGLEIIAFTDHNTVAGYRRLQEEIQQLEMLEKLNRLIPEEKTRLYEYRRLMSKILVLPGFEVTATFGFHIIGIFSPDKPTREIEHLLLNFNIPPNQLDDGSATVGATADVLTIY
ncbi:PHP domain-containing protein, partial [bacterium]